MRMLAYGIGADVVDEYMRMGESTALKCLKRFISAVIAVFGEEYMRRPNVADIERLLRVGYKRGFPGMLGSIDCMHWEWKNCPTAWQGQYERGDHKHPTIMLEVVASQDLWIWHVFFRLPSSLNDINILDRSPVFDEVLEGRVPEVNVTVNKNNYKLGYYLTDRIYPSWATFVKTIPRPQGPKNKLFAKKPESARKDVERAFGVLQARFAIISNPVRITTTKVIGEVMRACVIIHNMIVEDERDSYYRQFNYDNDPVNFNVSGPQNDGTLLAAYDDYIRNHTRIRNRSTNQQLHADIVEEIWNHFSGEVHDV